MASEQQKVSLGQISISFNRNLPAYAKSGDPEAYEKLVRIVDCPILNESSEFTIKPEYGSGKVETVDVLDMMALYLKDFMSPFAVSEVLEETEKAEKLYELLLKLEDKPLSKHGISFLVDAKDTFEKYIEEKKLHQTELGKRIMFLNGLSQKAAPYILVWPEEKEILHNA